jgi:hypothetical protein
MTSQVVCAFKSHILQKELTGHTICKTCAPVHSAHGSEIATLLSLIYQDSVSSVLELSGTNQFDYLPIFQKSES